MMFEKKASEKIVKHSFGLFRKDVEDLQARVTKLEKLLAPKKVKK